MSTILPFTPSAAPPVRQPKPADVVLWRGVTTLALPTDRVLRAALEYEFESVTIVGTLKDGTEYFASNVPDGPNVLWELARAQRKLLDLAGD